MVKVSCDTYFSVEFHHLIILNHAQLPISGYVPASESCERAAIRTRCSHSERRNENHTIAEEHRNRSATRHR